MSEPKITDEQLKLEVLDGLSTAEISKKYDLSMRSVQRRRARLAKKGWSPEHDMTKEVPDGYKIKGQ